MSAAKLIKKDRYPGIRSFEVDDERLFYGRTKEIDDLFSQVVIKPLVVLFSKSGLGKSSLLKAGLGPVLENNAFFPIMFRVQDTSVSPIDMVLSELKPFIDKNKIKQFGGKSANTIWEAINAGNFIGVDGNPATPVLIFDQFEELFNHEKVVQDQWASQMADLIEGRLPKDVVEVLQQIPRRERTSEQLDWFQPPTVKIVFAIRSDRMSELHQLRKEIPGILQNRYELKPLHSAQSAEAMERPAALTGTEFTTKPFFFAAETVKDIQNNLSNEAGEIESFQLQIVCQHIEQKVKELESKGVENIESTPDFVGGKKGILGILKNYYDDHIMDLGDDEDQLAARKLLEEGLIADGRRIGVADAVVKGTFGISDELLEKLLESRLIRPENTRLGRTFEISHDTLVAPILKSYDKRRRAEARIAKQKELEEREQQLAKEQKKRIFYYKFAAFAGVLSLVAIGAFVFAYLQWNKAEDSESKAESALFEAEASNARNEKIINAFYFHGDSLALAVKRDDYGRNMYGFINKMGETRIDYKYTAATPFDEETGYAKVVQMEKNYLLWPDKTEYLLANGLDELNSRITALDLQDNRLYDFPSSLYQQVQLKVLLLRGNPMRYLPRYIEKLSNLRALNLSMTELRVLRSEIGKLEHLEQLDLSSNQLTKIPPEIGKLIALKRLNLFSNTIDQLPPEIGNLKDLESLDLGYNKLESLPAEIGSLLNLTELNLMKNPLANFPSEIGKLIKLQDLNLQGLKLGTFPQEISQLVLLEELDFGGNSLKSLPPEIKKFKELESLFLNGNTLEELPAEIGNLGHLKTLNLNRNKLIVVPAEIGNLTGLEQLYLDFNQLESLPPEIGKLQNLQELGLALNNLESLPPEIGKLMNLKFLDLTGNLLSEEELEKISKLLPNCVIQTIE